MLKLSAMDYLPPDVTLILQRSSPARVQDSHGYMYVTLSVHGSDTDKKVHRLVAEAFIPNPDNKPQVNHKNGIKSDCHATNLEWVTARENLQHACDHGLNRHFKLNDKDRTLIYRMHTELRVRKNRIAALFNMSPPGIAYVINTYQEAA